MTNHLITRHRDWQARLQACLAERQARPFSWGQQDCCLYVCDAVLAMTGHDPAADVRGYRSEREALRIVKRLGGLRAIGASRFGPEVAPALAQVGDVGLAALDGRETLLLCGGAMWLGPAEDGVGQLPCASIVAAWRCI